MVPLIASLLLCSVATGGHLLDVTATFNYYYGIDWWKHCQLSLCNRQLRHRWKVLIYAKCYKPADTMILLHIHSILFLQMSHPFNIISRKRSKQWIISKRDVVVMVVFFAFHDLRWEMVVRFVKICGIVDSHFLNFHFLYIFDEPLRNQLVDLKKHFCGFFFPADWKSRHR